MAPRPDPGGAGFTLVELMVVLTVAALILALAAPSLRNAAPGAETRAAARALRDDLRRARAAAIRENRETWVSVDVDADAHAIDGGPWTPAPEGAELTLRGALEEMARDGRGRIRFFPDGASTGGTVTIVLGPARRTVAVDWFDGSVTVDAPDR